MFLKHSTSILACLHQHSHFLHEYQALSSSSNFPVWASDGRRYSTGLTGSRIFLSLRSFFREICPVIYSQLSPSFSQDMSGHPAESLSFTDGARVKVHWARGSRVKSAECSLRYEAAIMGQPCCLLLGCGELWFSQKPGSGLHWTDTILGWLWGSNCVCFSYDLWTQSCSQSDTETAIVKLNIHILNLG